MIQCRPLLNFDCEHLHGKEPLACLLRRWSDTLLVVVSMVCNHPKAGSPSTHRLQRCLLLHLLLLPLLLLLPATRKHNPDSLPPQMTHLPHSMAAETSPAMVKSYQTLVQRGPAPKPRAAASAAALPSAAASIPLMLLQLPPARLRTFPAGTTQNSSP